MLLDAGANADCAAAWLVQFAQMGSAFARHRYGLATPRVGLLSIGEEKTKGNALVKLEVKGESVEAEPVYFTPKLPTSIGGAVEVGGFLYGTNMGGLLCAEFITGKQRWQDRCVGPASVCCADGQLYIHGENGAVALVEALAAPSPVRLEADSPQYDACGAPVSAAALVSRRAGEPRSGC